MLKNVIKILAAAIVLAATFGCVSYTEPVTVSTPLDKDVFALLEKADNYYAQGRLTEAESEYREIISRYPKYSYAWFKLGNIFVRTGQLDAAVIHYSEAVSVDPENSKAWYNLSLVRVKQAIASSDEGLSVIPVSDVDRARLELLQQRLLKIVN